MTNRVSMLAPGQSPLILASQSRARQAVLAGAGLTFEALPAELDERAIEEQSGLTAPGEVAECLARAKASVVCASHPGRYVIGADQTLETVTHRITVRRSDAIRSGMRFRMDERLFGILTVYDPDESGRYLICETREEGR